MSSPGKKPVIRSQTREIIFNVFKYFKSVKSLLYIRCFCTNHPDLNPIELIWATVKNNVSKKNITFKLEDVRKLAEHEFDQITPEEWQKRCQHVINIEQKYLENEAFIDIHTEINPLIINLNDDSSTSSSESEENHYSDSTE
jgi:hypothetical protein